MNMLRLSNHVFYVFYPNPIHENAPKPMAIMIHGIVTDGIITYAPSIRKIVCVKNAKIEFIKYIQIHLTLLTNFAIFTSTIEIFSNLCSG